MNEGLLVLDKPRGPTSFQVVARLRKVTAVRKIGHVGTLDPLAGGVLPICIGRAVRLAEYLQSDDKVYIADVTLGVRTSTDDAEGEVLSRKSVTTDRAALESVLPEFVGEIEQVPPQYAAIKVAGQPMYALARKGTPVDAAPRKVSVYRLSVLEWEAPRVRLEIACGKGTYVRALARDLGERLGCGAFLSGLTRTRCGVFELSAAVGLGVLEQAADWRAYLQPMDAGLPAWERVELDRAGAARVFNGLPLPAKERSATPALLRAYGPDGAFIAILRADPARGELLPEKVFLPAQEDEAERPTA